jgi:hypothetical protein
MNPDRDLLITNFVESLDGGALHVESATGAVLVYFDDSRGDVREVSLAQVMAEAGGFTEQEVRYAEFVARGLVRAGENVRVHPMVWP